MIYPAPLFSRESIIRLSSLDENVPIVEVRIAVTLRPRAVRCRQCYDNNVDGRALPRRTELTTLNWMCAKI